MKLIQEKLVNIEFDHRLWLNEMSFAFKEITIYENRLLELIEAYEGKPEETPLGEILLSFIEQKNNAEYIKEQIREHLLHMNEKIHSNGELKAIINTVHHRTMDDVQVFREEYRMLKEKVRKIEAFQN